MFCILSKILHSHFAPFFFQETMPEWPPLILDQANNLLVRNINVNDPNTRMFCIFILFPRLQTRPRPTLAFEDCPCRSGRLQLYISQRNPSKTTRVEKYLRFDFKPYLQVLIFFKLNAVKVGSLTLCNWDL